MGLVVTRYMQQIKSFTWLFFLSNLDFLNILNWPALNDIFIFHIKNFRKTNAKSQNFPAVSNDRGYGRHCVSFLPRGPTLWMSSSCRRYACEIIIIFMWIIILIIIIIIICIKIISIIMHNQNHNHHRHCQWSSSTHLSILKRNARHHDHHHAFNHLIWSNQMIIQLDGIEMPVQDMGPILGEVMKGSYR